MHTQFVIIRVDPPSLEVRACTDSTTVYLRIILWQCRLPWWHAVLFPSRKSGWKPFRYEKLAQSMGVSLNLLVAGNPSLASGSACPQHGVKLLE